jgi:hypothetical protein
MISCSLSNSFTSQTHPLAQKLVQNDKKHPCHVILNAVKNPAHSLGESCLKGDKGFTTHTLTHAVGILPRPKARSE